LSAVATHTKQDVDLCPSGGLSEVRLQVSVLLLLLQERLLLGSGVEGDTMAKHHVALPWTFLVLRSFAAEMR
jgi:hypothetical protein